LDWANLTLFMMVLARMTGFVLFNPIFGRRGIPGIVKSGLILLMSVTVYTMAPAAPEVPRMLLELAVMFLLELALGYVLGLVVNFFFYIPLLAGSVIDTQMGMSMGATYDPGTQSSVSTADALLNVLMSLIFFAANGHHTLLRILLTSGEVIPFGAVAFGSQLYSALLSLFIDCTVLAVKLCMPVLAAELLGQIGMGVLMKAIPQINVFAINIELKVMIGLGLVFALMTPFSEYLLEAERTMLRSIQHLLPIIAP
jgi:flagellar biosynthetic protein FliR